MKCYTDLHIHSALSPCGSEDMTPNNIVNMAIIKGLDIIAVTDHNCCRNLPAIMKCAKDSGLVVVPGMEVETREEIHVLTLFDNIDDCFKMSETVKNALPPIKNNAEIFGVQQVLDHNDTVIDIEEQMLITATQLSIDDLVKHARALNGVPIPAHIDKNAYSIISNLGFIPDDLNFSALEISKNSSIDDFLSKYDYLRKYKAITSSDAHYLWDISEREFYIELEEKSVDALIDYLKAKH